MRGARGLWIAAVGVALLLPTSAAWAQHSHTMGIVSDAAGSGQLQLDWDFDTYPIARTSDTGLPGVFSGNIPGFNDGAGDLVTTFPLTDGTDADVEVTAIDAGLSWIFGSGTLDEAGESTYEGTMPNMHNHATFQAVTDDEKTFAEGRISFRVNESTAVPFGYTSSAVRTLIVSNGYLPPLETADKNTLKCQKTVAGEVRKLTAKTYQLIGKCMDAVLAHVMLEKSEKPALKKCSIDELDSKSLVSNLGSELEKSVGKVVKSCGPLSDSSVPYTESQIYTHLGMAQCRGEELAGATYNHAAELIGDVLEAATLGDHHDVVHALPCLKASFE